MFSRALLFLLTCSLLPAAKKPQPIADGLAGDNDVSIKATVYADPAAIQQLIGSDLDGHYIVVKIDLTPHKKFAIDHDDFLLRTDKDGERSHPFEPTQIAGDGALVISDAAQSGGGTHADVPVFGGSVGMGNSAQIMGNKATIQEATGRKNPILDTLQARILPQKDVEQPISGLLYFPMEKQKVKDLELIVTTPSGKLNLRFTK